MIKLFLFVVLSTSLVFAQEIKPLHKFKALGFVNDFFVSKDKIYIVSDMGSLEIYSLKSQKIVDRVLLDPLVTLQGTMIDPHILSVDVRGDKVLFVSTTLSGYRNVWLYNAHKLTLLVDESKELTVQEARFIDDERVMFSTLGADLILHDFSENYNAYRTHISDSKIGDYQLSKDKKTMVVADESGAVKVVGVADAKLLDAPIPQNLDNIFHLAYANGVILTAGQDRRVGVYLKHTKPYYIKTDFLVYCVGLSPSAKVGVYSKGEENILQIFNPYTKQNLRKLVGHRGIVNQIKFVSENELYSSDRSRYVYFWRF